MDAMILAAGLGTRLRPITEEIPKALVEVGGVPMLQLVAERLIDAGATRLVVNIHHHPQQVIDFIRAHDGFGVETVVSDESGDLLETGGALLKAAPLLRRDAPFFLHNVDVMTDIDLESMVAGHVAHDPLATLAVMQREAKRYLLFDEEQNLCGFGNAETGLHREARPPVGATERLGFSGVHVLSPRILGMITETGAFSIIPMYMRLVSEGHSIRAHRVDTSAWIDIGRPEQLEQARVQVEAGRDRSHERLR
ncbi:MAG TPA: nucleotidyltransferase family protein [Candidatus Kapabacteria bacterium]|nr:nucleotidyltransferase family protein [Candidatus Kapabacteria bacterium]